MFHETSTLVTVPCLVTDGRGRLVGGLPLDDFRLYVDGARRQIDHLWQEAELPLLLGVINDVSESQRNRASENERAATQLLERVVHGQDRAFLVTVNENVMLKSEVTEGPYWLRYKVLARGGEPLGVQCGSLEGDHGRKRPVCGGTALWNAVYAAAHVKLNGAAGNKALLILSDGNDTGSTHSFDEAREEVQRTGAVVYAIQYPDALSAEPPSGELRRLAEETGGRLFELHGMDYSDVLGQIAADLRGPYVIGFRPESSGAEGQRHSIGVEVVRPGVTVLARREYFGP